MATSLMNDSTYITGVIENLISAAEILFIDLDNDIQKLELELGE
jgi:hypothetical protein